MIQVEELTVVLAAHWGTLIQERSAQEFVFDFAGQSTCSFAGYLKLLVGVIVETGVLGHFVISNTKARDTESSDASFAGLDRAEAEVFEVIYTLGICELDELPNSSAVCVAQLALEGSVVVLDTSAGESVFI